MFDQIDLARARVRGGILDRPLFHFRDAGRHRHHDPGRNQFAMVNLLNEMPQHRFGDFEVGNDTIFHGPDGDDVARGATEHALGFFANRQHIGGSRLNGNNGRFTQYNTLVTNVNERIRCPEIYPNIVGKQALKLREHELCLAPSELKCYTV